MSGIPLRTVSLNRWHSVDLIPYHLLVQKFMWRGACVRSIIPLPSLHSLSLSALSGLYWKLGSNLPAPGCVSCIGAVAQSICLHQWAGAAVGLGQQDPAKHQLLAAFYTDSHQVGHIYSTASRPVRLEDLSALGFFLFFSSGFVLFVRLSTACSLSTVRHSVYLAAFTYVRVQRLTREQKAAHVSGFCVLD